MEEDNIDDLLELENTPNQTDENPKILGEQGKGIVKEIMIWGCSGIIAIIAFLIIIFFLFLYWISNWSPN